MNRIAMQVSIRAISEVSFANNTPIEILNFDKDEIHVRLGLEILPRAEEKEITLLLGVNYHWGEKGAEEDLLAYNISVTFGVNDYDNHITAIDNHHSVKPELLALFTGVAVGSLRGMLALRTQGTVYDNYPLPIINITQIIASIQGNSLKNSALNPLVRFKFE